MLVMVVSICKTVQKRKEVLLWQYSKMNPGSSQTSAKSNRNPHVFYVGGSTSATNEQLKRV